MSIQKLTKAEEEVMQLFWEHGPSTVSGLIDHMLEPKPPHSTISSIARILERKGFLTHKAYGRTYEYYPNIKKEDYSHSSIRRLVKDYFEGSVHELVSFLVREKDVSLQDLSALIDRLEQENEDQ